MRHGNGSRSDLPLEETQERRPPLERLVQGDLHKSPYEQVQCVKCRMQGQALILSGRVSSYYLKQVAQLIALDRVGRQATVVNELQVEP